MHVKIEATNTHEILDALNNAKNHIKDMTPLMEEMAEHLYEITDYSFETQSSPDGTVWSPIKKGTFKNYKLPTDKILYKSGDMRGNLDSFATKDSMGVGINVVNGNFQYPLTHQFGTDNAWGKGITVDARPFMPIKDDGELYDDTSKELVDLIEDYVKESIK